MSFLVSLAYIIYVIQYVYDSSQKKIIFYTILKFKMNSIEAKLKEYYPGIDEALLQKLYGVAQKRETKVGFQIDAFSTASDWLMLWRRQSHWLRAPPSNHLFENPSKEFWNKLVISKLVSKLGSQTGQISGWENTSDINLTEFYDRTKPRKVC